MKYLVLIAAFSFSLFANAQEPVARPNVPLEEGSGRVVYTDVKEAAGTQAVLYKRIQNWYKTFFTNPNEVVKEKDAERSMVLGKHGINIYREMAWGKETKTQKVGMVKYRIKVIAKDGRYKYKIDDIYLLKGTKEYIEMWLNDKLPQDQIDQNYQYLIQVDDHMQELIATLHEVMTDPGPDAPEEW